MTNDFVVFGIMASVIIKNVVNLAKYVGLDGKWPLMLAIVLGVLLAVSTQLAEMYPVFAIWYGVSMKGLFVGLAAAEIFQAQKAAAQTRAAQTQMAKAATAEAKVATTESQAPNCKVA